MAAIGGVTSAVVVSIDGFIGRRRHHHRRDTNRDVVTPGGGRPPPAGDAFPLVRPSHRHRHRRSASTPSGDVDNGKIHMTAPRRDVRHHHRGGGWGGKGVVVRHHHRGGGWGGRGVVARGGAASAADAMANFGDDDGGGEGGSSSKREEEGGGDGKLETLQVFFVELGLISMAWILTKAGTSLTLTRGRKV